jgi:hypothetical protein
VLLKRVCWQSETEQSTIYIPSHHIYIYTYTHTIAPPSDCCDCPAAAAAAAAAAITQHYIYNIYIYPSTCAICSIYICMYACVCLCDAYIHVYTCIYISYYYYGRRLGNYCVHTILRSCL